MNNRTVVTIIGVGAALYLAWLAFGMARDLDADYGLFGGSLGAGIRAERQALNQVASAAYANQVRQSVVGSVHQ